MNILPLKITNLNYTVNQNSVLKNLNLVTQEEKITIIAGNNGSGKSTLLKILHGLIKTSDDNIMWGQYSTNFIKKYQSMVFQNPILLNRSIYDNLIYVQKKRNIKEIGYVNKIMDKLNIKNISNINTKYISGGERQKVAIAMSIIGEPKIIFLDEPTSQLDPVYKNEIEKIISDLSKDGVKIFMTSHDVSQIKRIGKEIIFLNEGEIIFHNTVSEFLNTNHINPIKNYLTFG